MRKVKIILLKDQNISKSQAERTSDLDLVAKRDYLKQLIKEANEILANSVDPVLFERAEQQPERKYRVGNETVIIVSRPNYSEVPLEFARSKGAVKEVVDSKVLQPLYEKGVQIPGIKETEFVTVR